MLFYFARWRVCRQMTFIVRSGAVPLALQSSKTLLAAYYLMTISVQTLLIMIILLDPNLDFMLFHTKPKQQALLLLLSLNYEVPLILMFVVNCHLMHLKQLIKTFAQPLSLMALIMLLSLFAFFSVRYNQGLVDFWLNLWLNFHLFCLFYLFDLHVQNYYPVYILSLSYFNVETT